VKWSERDLRERAWKVVQPLFQLAGTEETTHELADIRVVAAEGHVEVLHGSTVHVLAAGEMAEDAPAAAILRQPLANLGKQRR
jgi:hypothetical protein